MSFFVEYIKYRSHGHTEKRVQYGLCIGGGGLKTSAVLTKRYFFYEDRFIMGCPNDRRYYDRSIKYNLSFSVILCHLCMADMVSAKRYRLLVHSYVLRNNN